MFCVMSEPQGRFLSFRAQPALVGCSRNLLLPALSAAAHTQSLLALVLVGKIIAGCSKNWPSVLVSQLGLR